MSRLGFMGDLAGWGCSRRGRTATAGPRRSAARQSFPDRRERQREGGPSVGNGLMRRRYNARHGGTPEERATTRCPPLRVVLLHALLILLAADAERRLRPSLEPLDGDLLAALLADAERALFDLLERLLDLVEEALLAATQAERERLQVLARGEIHLVGQIIGVERHVLLECLLGLLQDLVALLGQQRLEFFERGLVHSSAPLPWSSLADLRGRRAAQQRLPSAPVRSVSFAGFTVDLECSLVLRNVASPIPKRRGRTLIIGPGAVNREVCGGADPARPGHAADRGPAGLPGRGGGGARGSDGSRGAFSASSAPGRARSVYGAAGRRSNATQHEPCRTLRPASRRPGAAEAAEISGGRDRR